MRLCEISTFLNVFCPSGCFSSMELRGMSVTFRPNKPAVPVNWCSLYIIRCSQRETNTYATERRIGKQFGQLSSNELLETHVTTFAKCFQVVVGQRLVFWMWLFENPAIKPGRTPWRKLSHRYIRNYVKIFNNGTMVNAQRGSVHYCVIFFCLTQSGHSAEASMFCTVFCHANGHSPVRRNMCPRECSQGTGHAAQAREGRELRLSSCSPDVPVFYLSSPQTRVSTPLTELTRIQRMEAITSFLSHTLT